MCRFQILKTRLPASVCLSALVGLSTLMPVANTWAATCANVMSATPDIAFPPGNAGLARIGDTITLSQFFWSDSAAPPGQVNCDEKNIDCYYVSPDGAPQILVVTNDFILSAN